MKNLLLRKVDHEATFHKGFCDFSFKSFWGLQSVLQCNFSAQPSLKRLHGGKAKIHFTKSAFTEDKEFSLSSVNDIAGAMELQTNKKCYKLWCYNDVHATMNGKAENSSDLQDFQASYVPEVHVLNSCCETLVLEIEKRKKEKKRINRRQPRHRKNYCRFERISFGSASKGFEIETENLVHGKVRCNLRVIDLCPMVHFFCCFSCKREKMKQLLIGLVEG